MDAGEWTARRATIEQAQAEFDRASARLEAAVVEVRRLERSWPLEPTDEQLDEWYYAQHDLQYAGATWQGARDRLAEARGPEQPSLFGGGESNDER